MGGINYLFPPEQLTYLPSWRFVMHFPGKNDPESIKAATSALKEAEFKVVEFPDGLDLSFDEKTSSIDIGFQVPEDDRRQNNAVAQYESDVWKFWGTWRVAVTKKFSTKQSIGANSHGKSGGNSGSKLQAK